MSAILSKSRMFSRFITTTKLSKRHQTTSGIPLAKAHPKHPEKDVIYHTEDLKFIYNASDVKKKHIYDVVFY